MSLQVRPSLLAADFADLGAAVAAAERGGADSLHCDVMDGHFVPNISYGVPIVAAVKARARLPLDVHLMVTEPERWVLPFHEAGAAAITIHVEATRHPQRVLAEIRKLGCRAGIALNPATGPEALDYLWGEFDEVLLMTVNPGFGGQKFLPAVLSKVAAVSAATHARGFAVPIVVDGGVSEANIAATAGAGATAFVAGSSVYGAPDPAAAIRSLRAAAQGAQAL
ncbi:MAG TPA: ribulose-phosphate 3-epimerase [Bacillota bacterium]|nr:ribulose-phosphate 3-epimerase [Bacillota bacterium]